MPSTSRRRLLAGSGTLLASAVAGCTGVVDGDRSGATSNATDAAVGDERDRRPTDAPSDEYELLAVREPGDRPIVYPDEDAVPDPDADDHDAEMQRYLNSAFHIVDDDGAAAVVIDRDTDAADAIRSFVDATDYETESIVVDHRSIDDCYRRYVLGVRATADDFHADYCRRLKPPTTPCEADRTTVEALFFRLQRPYEESPRSRSSSERASCPDEVLADDGDATPTGSTDGEIEPVERGGDR